MHTENPEVTELTPEELETYLRLQKKVGYRRSGKEVFESFWGILPMVVYELAVVRVINDARSVLMWYRDDEHYTGWHMPGGYLLLGESDMAAISRILRAEVGLAANGYRFVHSFNMGPDSGWVSNHQLALLWLVSADGEPKRGKFFPLNDLPDNTLGHHRHYIRFV